MYINFKVAEKLKNKIVFMRRSVWHADLMSLVVSSKALHRMLCSTSNEVRFGSTLNFLTGREELFFSLHENSPLCYINSKLFKKHILGRIFYIFSSIHHIFLRKRYH